MCDRPIWRWHRRRSAIPWRRIRHSPNWIHWLLECKQAVWQRNRHPGKDRTRVYAGTVTVSGSSSNLDFVGNPVANAYAVSGRVIDSRDGSGLYKVSFTFSGGFGRTQSDVYGDWSKSGLYGTVTVTPSRPGWTFVPESRVVTGTDSFVDFSGTPTGSSASDGGGR